jgi:hypothetical protein
MAHSTLVVDGDDHCLETELNEMVLGSMGTGVQHAAP